MSSSKKPLIILSILFVAAASVPGHAAKKVAKYYGEVTQKSCSYQTEQGMNALQGRCLVVVKTRDWLVVNWNKETSDPFFTARPNKVKRQVRLTAIVAYPETVKDVKVGEKFAVNPADLTPRFKKTYIDAIIKEVQTPFAKGFRPFVVSVARAAEITEESGSGNNFKGMKAQEAKQ